MEWRLVKLTMLVIVAGLFGCGVPAGAEQGTADLVKAVVYVDGDWDGIPDYLDSCPGRSNVGGVDSDGDLLADDCDLDPTGNGSIRPIVRDDQIAGWQGAQ